MRLTQWLPLLILIGLIMGGCKPTVDAVPPADPETIQPTTEASATAEPTLTPTEVPADPTSTPPTLETVMPTQEPPPPQDSPSGDVPSAILNMVVADLSQRTGVDAGDIRVMSAESIVWNDGSLGCPQPGLFYTQALIPGYRVILLADRDTYDYHIAERGNFIVCGSEPILNIPPAKGTDEKVPPPGLPDD